MVIVIISIQNLSRRDGMILNTHGFADHATTKIVEKGKTPELYIAGENDFGNCRRLQHLQYPDLRGQLVLVQVRSLQVTVKMSSNSRGQQNYTLNRLKGHAILFLHDAPQLVKSLIADVDYLENILKLHFVDEEGQFDRLAKEAFGTTTILARQYVIKHWLLVLQSKCILIMQIWKMTTLKT
jgi:hypothetical protein